MKPGSISKSLTSPTFLSALTSLCGDARFSVEDPEIRYFRRIEDYLAGDPVEYRRWLNRVAMDRLRSDWAHADLASIHMQMSSLMATAELSSYACAEAMQVCVSDLILLEDLESAGLPVQSLELLRNELLGQSLDLVARIVRNIAVRMRMSDALNTYAQSPAIHLADLDIPTPAVVPTGLGEPVLVILTAGRGTRLRSTIPKGLIPIGGMPMIRHIVGAATASGLSHMIFILKYRSECQADYFAQWGRVIIQDRAEGTGHSALFALSALAAQADPVLLSFSDQPFLSEHPFRRLMKAMASPKIDMAVSTFSPAQSDTGRIIRNEKGSVLEISQPRLAGVMSSEGDGGLYAVRSGPFSLALSNVRNDNARREFNLPDAVRELTRTRGCVHTVSAPAAEFQSVNTPRDLVLAQLRAATGLGHSEAGVAAFFASRGAAGSSPHAIARSGLERTEYLVGPILDLGPGAP